MKGTLEFGRVLFTEKTGALLLRQMRGQTDVSSMSHGQANSLTKRLLKAGRGGQTKLPFIICGWWSFEYPAYRNPPPLWGKALAYCGCPDLMVSGEKMIKANGWNLGGKKTILPPRNFEWGAFGYPAPRNPPPLLWIYVDGFDLLFVTEQMTMVCFCMLVNTLVSVSVWLAIYNLGNHICTVSPSFFSVSIPLTTCLHFKALGIVISPNDISISIIMPKELTYLTTTEPTRNHPRHQERF